MNTNHYNELTESELELLACLAEECGEVIHIVGKILRHGYDSYHPDTGDNNRELLHKEVGDVLAIVDLMDRVGNLNKYNIAYHKSNKLCKIGEYIHHVEVVENKGD